MLWFVACLLNLPYFLIEFPQKIFFFDFGNPKVTVHRCEETIQGRKLYEEIGYLINTTLVAFKDAAVTSCQTLNPGASLLMPKSIHDQQVLEQFLKRSDLTSEIFLGAEKKESGHWFWDDEKQMFVSGKIYIFLFYLFLTSAYPGPSQAGGPGWHVPPTFCQIS